LTPHILFFKKGPIIENGYFCECIKEIHRGVWKGDIEKGYHLEKGGVDGRMIFNWILKVSGGRELAES